MLKKWIVDFHHNGRIVKSVETYAYDFSGAMATATREHGELKSGGTWYTRGLVSA
jgi:hypothetical protein